MKDVLENWNPGYFSSRRFLTLIPDDTTVPSYHYNSICYFNYETELQKALAYREADVPYVLYNIPSLEAATKRWSSSSYLTKLFSEEVQFPVEKSTYHNHFLYSHGNDAQHQFKDRTGEVGSTSTLLSYVFSLLGTLLVSTR